MRIVISCGDPSGDVRSAELLEELKVLTNIEVSGFGGRNIRNTGAEILYSLKEFSVMGFTEVLSSLAKLRKLREGMRKHILKTDPDILLLVDYPGFNIPLAVWAKKKGYRVVYYISPQLWAWGSKRVRKIRSSTDLMITLFEFEVAFYQQHGVRAVCSGHPLADSIPKPFESIPGNEIAYLPGSRRQEISQLLKPMMDSFTILRDRGAALSATVAVSPDIPAEFYERARTTEGVKLVYSVEEALENASAAVVCSGTVTLETAMWGVPFIIAYKTSPLTYFLAKLLVKEIKYIGMSNLVAGSLISRELIQKDVTSGNIVRYITPLLQNTELREKSVTSLKLVREALGDTGSSRRAAEYVLEAAADDSA